MYNKCSQGCHTATGTHMPHGITQCYLPPGRGDIPALTLAEAGTRLNDARPTVTFSAAGHRRPLTDTKLYCLVTEAHVCEQLAQGCYVKAERSRFELATF